MLFFFLLWLFSCFAVMLISIDREKTFASLGFLIFFSLHSYPFCVLLSRCFWIVYARGLTVWIRYIMFCLPSLMMFAIYIKKRFLDYSHSPTTRLFREREILMDIDLKKICTVLRARENETFSSLIVKRSLYSDKMMNKMNDSNTLNQQNSHWISIVRIREPKLISS